jgi:hypothetical protein
MSAESLKLLHNFSKSYQQPDPVKTTFRVKSESGYGKVSKQRFRVNQYERSSNDYNNTKLTKDNDDTIIHINKWKDCVTYALNELSDIFEWDDTNKK